MFLNIHFKSLPTEINASIKIIFSVLTFYRTDEKTRYFLEIIRTIQIMISSLLHVYVLYESHKIISKCSKLSNIIMYVLSRDGEI